MRLLALALLFATPLAAQTAELTPTPPLPDSTETLPELTTADLLGETDGAPARFVPYTSLGVDGGWSGLLGVTAGVTGRAGVETASGVRLGAVASVLTTGAASTVAVGPEVTFRRALGRGVQLRATGQSAIGATVATRFDGERVASQRLTLGGRLEIEREVPIAGSFRLAPRLGAFGTAGRFSAVPAYGLDARTLGSAGLLLGTDVRFRALGRDWSVPVTVPVPLTGGLGFDALGQPLGGASLRLGF